MLEKVQTRNEIIYSSLTVEKNLEKSGSIPDINDVEQPVGSTISLSATTRTGYRFNNWSSVAGNFANENAASTTFTMPNEDVIVTANYSSIISGGGSNVFGSGTVTMVIMSIYGTTVAGLNDIDFEVSIGGGPYQPLNVSAQGSGIYTASVPGGSRIRVCGVVI